MDEQEQNAEHMAAEWQQETPQIIDFDLGELLWHDD